MKFTTDIVIGLEIHVQLDTKTKLFCGCATKGSEEPNTRTCPACLGFPGSKPVLNKRAVDYALRLCLALGCEISPKLIFSRKSYFYPDLAKNYQISQYEIPLGLSGELRLSDWKMVGITRVHMEEDPASLIHTKSTGASAYVLVDYNRSGIPLCEVVTEPDMASPDQARDFMKRLMTVLSYLDIFDEQTCVIKADANISIKESGYVRSEIKNITGFKEIERALFYEVERQKIAVRSGEKLMQDTRGWDAEKGMTFHMRAKETEADYGYILDPDLVVTEIPSEWLKQVKASMPELAEDKIRKYVETHKIAQLDAEVIAQERKLAELFEKVAKEVDPVLAAKWMRRELVRVMSFNKITFHDLLVDEKHLIELLSMVEKKEITEQVAQKIMEELVVKPFSPRQYVEKHGLKRVAETGALLKVCEEVIKENKNVVEEYLAGKEKSFQFLVGQVMRKTKGAASPQEVNELLRKLLKSKS
ncbi:Asp-tRNA(Asn)/Glu-tRNA(Gln) amidotransferase subunit GatB [Candidatus Woesearchaeota archaeon]|nr:Asp-tRNA(Asn)/Glu-tRNA(Gln) amidotransferase subunit GatB [Candidatus Woesearchaeota archaeon]